MANVRLQKRKRKISPITAAHNELFVGNVSFAIRKRTFASVNLNDRCGSISVIWEGSQAPHRMTPYGYQLPYEIPQLDGRSAIRKPPFATASWNGRFGSTPALRGCHAIERFCDAGEGQPSAINGRSLEPLAMAAYGSESGRSDDALQTAGFDPHETFANTKSGRLEAALKPHRRPT